MKRSNILTNREKRWLREQRALWRIIASCQWGSRLDDADFRQRVYRMAEEQAAICDARLTLDKQASRSRGEKE